MSFASFVSFLVAVTTLSGLCTAAVRTGELATNGGAEVDVSGWVRTRGSIGRKSAAIDGKVGVFYFFGGTDGDSEYHQWIDVRPHAPELSNGNGYAQFAAQVGGYGGDTDSAAVHFDLCSSMASCGTRRSLAEVTPVDRGGVAKLLPRSSAMCSVPSDTRFIRVTLHMVRGGGFLNFNNDGYVDGVSVRLILAPAAAVGQNLVMGPGSERSQALCFWTDGFTALGRRAASVPGSRGAFMYTGRSATPREATQWISVARDAAAVSAGQRSLTVAALLGGLGAANDATTVRVEQWSAGRSTMLRSFSLGPVLAAQRGSVTKLIAVSGRDLVVHPTTGYLKLVLASSGPEAYVDDIDVRLVLRIAPPSSTPTPSLSASSSAVPSATATQRPTDTVSLQHTSTATQSASLSLSTARSTTATAHATPTVTRHLTQSAHTATLTQSAKTATTTNIAIPSTTGSITKVWTFSATAKLSTTLTQRVSATATGTLSATHGLAASATVSLSPSASASMVSSKTVGTLSQTASQRGSPTTTQATTGTTTISGTATTTRSASSTPTPDKPSFSSTAGGRSSTATAQASATLSLAISTTTGPTLTTTGILTTTQSGPTSRSPSSSHDSTSTRTNVVSNSVSLSRSTGALSPSAAVSRSQSQSVAESRSSTLPSSTPSAVPTVSRARTATATPNGTVTVSVQSKATTSPRATNTVSASPSTTSSRLHPSTVSATPQHLRSASRSPSVSLSGSMSPCVSVTRSRGSASSVRSHTPDLPRLPSTATSTTSSASKLSATCTSTATRSATTTRRPVRWPSSTTTDAYPKSRTWTHTPTAVEPSRSAQALTFSRTLHSATNNTPSVTAMRSPSRPHSHATVTQSRATTTKSRVPGLSTTRSYSRASSLTLSQTNAPTSGVEGTRSISPTLKYSASPSHAVTPTSTPTSLPRTATPSVSASHVATPTLGSLATIAPAPAPVRRSLSAVFESIGSGQCGGRYASFLAASVLVAIVPAAVAAAVFRTRRCCEEPAANAGPLRQHALSFPRTFTSLHAWVGLVAPCHAHCASAHAVQWAAHVGVVVLGLSLAASSAFAFVVEDSWVPAVIVGVFVASLATALQPLIAAPYWVHWLEVVVLHGGGWRRRSPQDLLPFGVRRDLNVGVSARTFTKLDDVEFTQPQQASRTGSSVDVTVLDTTAVDVGDEQATGSTPPATQPECTRVDIPGQGARSFCAVSGRYVARGARHASVSSLRRMSHLLVGDLTSAVAPGGNQSPPTPTQSFPTTVELRVDSDVSTLDGDALATTTRTLPSGPQSLKPQRHRQLPTSVVLVRRGWWPVLGHALGIACCAVTIFAAAVVAAPFCTAADGWRFDAVARCAVAAAVSDALLLQPLHAALSVLRRWLMDDRPDPGPQQSPNPAAGADEGSDFASSVRTAHVPASGTDTSLWRAAVHPTHPIDGAVAAFRFDFAAKTSYF